MFLLPIAGAARLFHWNAGIVLVVNLIAIIFLSDIISSASDELADSLGHLQGALIGATLGNTVEITVRITCCCCCSNFWITLILCPINIY